MDKEILQATVELWTLSVHPWTKVFGPAATYAESLTTAAATYPSLQCIFNHRSNGSSIQGAVASISRPSSGSSRLIFCFISQAILR
jgi:hypothetical protein